MAITVKSQAVGQLPLGGRYVILKKKKNYEIELVRFAEIKHNTVEP